MRFGSRDTVGSSAAVSHQRLDPRIVMPSMTLAGKTTGTTVYTASPTTGGSAHTMGSWAELVDVAPRSNLLRFVVSGFSASATNTGTLVDIGIGGAGSEVVVVPYLNLGVIAVNTKHFFDIPIDVPGGSRIAVRCQSNQTASARTFVAALANVDDYASPSALVDIGTVSASSLGTAVAGGNASKGSWVELTSSTSVPARGVIIGAGINGSTAFTPTGNALIDIGVGSAGSETVLIADVPLQGNASEGIEWYLRTGGVYAAAIPQGSRVAARIQNAASTATYDVSCLLVP